MKYFIAQYILCNVMSNRGCTSHTYWLKKELLIFQQVSLSQKKKELIFLVVTLAFRNLLFSSIFIELDKRKPSRCAIGSMKSHCRGLNSSPGFVFELLKRGALKISLSHKNLSVMGNWTSVSVAQWTRQKLKLFSCFCFLDWRTKPENFWQIKRNRSPVCLYGPANELWIIHQCLSLIQH